MDSHSHVLQLTHDAALYSVADVLQTLKSTVKAISPSGYYSIFVDSFQSLPPPFDAILAERRSNLLYIGIAKKQSLYDRLEQELFCKKPGTFFRSIGAILNGQAEPGTLVGKKNSNYTFLPDDKKRIIDWNKEHLRIRFFPSVLPSNDIEADVIRRCYPLLNILHNDVCLEVDQARKKCIKIAKSSP